MRVEDSNYIKEHLTSEQLAHILGLKRFQKSESDYGRQAIEAIKYIRKITGVGLKEAKDFYDELALPREETHEVVDE